MAWLGRGLRGVAPKSRVGQGGEASRGPDWLKSIVTGAFGSVPLAPLC